MIDIREWLYNTFLKHPHEVGETYWQHFGCAFSYFLLFAKMSFQCLIHAFVPSAFNGRISEALRKLHCDMIENRIDREK